MMRKSHQEIRESLKMDKLLSLSRKDFEGIVDHRASNSQHLLPDVLMSGLAMFSLKYPSLLDFEQQTVAERENLHHLFGVKRLCSDAQMRKILDEVSPASISELYPNLFKELGRAGLVQSYHYWPKEIIVSVDGVTHFHSNKIHCDQCQCTQHRDGSISYSHSMLCAAMVHPQKREVFVMGSEPIIKTDGAKKNDCELNAAKRLVPWLSEHYPGQKFLLVEDALYANGPHLRQILEHQYHFIINVKPDSHKSLFNSFESRKERKQTRTFSYRSQGYHHRFEFCNNLPLNGSAADLRVNFLLYEQQDPKGKTTRFTWISSRKLSRRNVDKVMRAARARWKIENETFNTLKNQGYHFEHNYGHGHKYLATVLAFLMLLAFLIDQIVQACQKSFQKIWAALKTKAKLWSGIRALFQVQIFNSFAELYQNLARLYSVQIE